MQSSNKLFNALDFRYLPKDTFHFTISELVAFHGIEDTWFIASFDLGKTRKKHVSCRRNECLIPYMKCHRLSFNPHIFFPRLSSFFFHLDNSYI